MFKFSALNRMATVILVTELTVIGGVVLSLIAVVTSTPPGLVSPAMA